MHIKLFNFYVLIKYFVTVFYQTHVFIFFCYNVLLLFIIIINNNTINIFYHIFKTVYMYTLMYTSINATFVRFSMWQFCQLAQTFLTKSSMSFSKVFRCFSYAFFLELKDVK